MARREFLKTGRARRRGQTAAAVGLAAAHIATPPAAPT